LAFFIAIFILSTITVIAFFKKLYWT
jgi:hypothetical protein